MKRLLKYLPLVILGAYSIFVGVRYFTNNRQVGGYTFNPFTQKLDYSATVPVSDTVVSTTYNTPVIAPSSSSYGFWGKTGVFSSSTLFVDATSTFGGSIMASGTTGVTPGSGPGTRLMWIPSKGALRAGTVDGTQWDNSNIGLYSIAVGFNAQATGQDGTAVGYYTSASGVRGTAIGNGASAIGSDSVAAGQSAAAWGPGSSAFGRAATTFGQFATAVGNLTVAEGLGSTALGSSPYILGNYSVMIGVNPSYIPASKTSYLNNTFIVAGGNSTFGTTTLASHVLTVSATSTPGGVVLIKGLASQTGDYFDIQNSDSTSLLKVSTTTFGFNSGYQIKRTYINATAYTAALTDYYLSASSTSQAVTITLPSAAAACGVGSSQFVVKDKNGSAGTNNITIARSGSDTIDGATSKVISNNFGSYSFTSDCSANWEVN